MLITENRTCADTIIRYQGDKGILHTRPCNKNETVHAQVPFLLHGRVASRHDLVRGRHIKHMQHACMRILYLCRQLALVLVPFHKTLGFMLYLGRYIIL